MKHLITVFIIISALSACGGGGGGGSSTTTTTTTATLTAPTDTTPPLVFPVKAIMDDWIATPNGTHGPTTQQFTVSDHYQPYSGPIGYGTLTLTGAVPTQDYPNGADIHYYSNTTLEATVNGISATTRFTNYYHSVYTYNTESNKRYIPLSIEERNTTYTLVGSGTFIEQNYDMPAYPRNAKVGDNGVVGYMFWNTNPTPGAPSGTDLTWEIVHAENSSYVWSATTWELEPNTDDTAILLITEKRVSNDINATHYLKVTQTRYVIDTAHVLAIKSIDVIEHPTGNNFPNSHIVMMFQN